jgi:hypothetical protein
LVETAFLIGIDEAALLRLLDTICSLWKSGKGFFEMDLTRLARAIARKDEMLFVFSVYSCGFRGNIILTLFTEYQKDLGAATIWIQASPVLPQVWGTTNPLFKGFETRMSTLFDSLDGHIEDGVVSFKEDFECPNCKARYSSRVLRHEEGKVQCQNCAKWFDLDTGP